MAIDGPKCANEANGPTGGRCAATDAGAGSAQSLTTSAGGGARLGGASPPAEPQLDSLPRGSLNRQVFILALPMLGEQFVNFLVVL